jgi:hypothetical protein
LIGQLIKNIDNVPSRGIQPLNIKKGFYILAASLATKTISRKIEVY